MVNYIVVGAAFNRKNENLIITKTDEKDMKEKVLKVAKCVPLNDGDCKILSNNE